MRVAKHKVVTIDYTLTDEHGAVVDSSKGGHPLSYIQGIGNIIPGLENALEGKVAGESLTVVVPPAEGYGMRDESLVTAVPRDRFEDAEKLRVGMRFQTAGEEGANIFTLVDLDDGNVTLDANHPLAGANLNFDVIIVDVRDATAEELGHGHTYGPGGHDH